MTLEARIVAALEAVGIDIKALGEAVSDRLPSASVGSAPNEVPSAQHLGQLAFADTVGLLDVYQHVPDSRPNQLWYSYVSNTDIRLKFHGLDGVAREISLVGPVGPKGDKGDKGDAADALAAVLTGLVTSDASGVLTTDNILQAIGKLQAQASGKVDKVAGKVLSSNDFTDTERTKLAGIAEQATKNDADAQLRDRSTHTGTQAISTVSELQSALDAKEATGTAASQLTAHTNAADPHPQYTTAAEAAAIAPVQSVAGRTGAVTLSKADVGLSAVDNTSDALKPVSTATQTALDTKAPISHVGSGGAAHSVATTSAAGFMAAADKTKLDGVAIGATANATDAQLRDRATHTGAQAISTVTGLQAALDGKLNSTNVGSSPAELPSNQHLGALAFLDTLGATQVTQHTRDSQPGDVWHEWVSNTQLRKKFHGLDGVIRTITETYA